MTPDPFALFSDRLRKRWATGAKQYGDVSFHKPLIETCGEIVQEIEDQAGWLFILWIQARMAAGEAIDLAKREQLETEFLAAMRIERESRNPVQQIEWMASCVFDRWCNARAALFDVVRAFEVTA